MKKLVILSSLILLVIGMVGCNNPSPKKDNYDNIEGVLTENKTDVEEDEEEYLEQFYDDEGNIVYNRRKLKIKDFRFLEEYNFDAIEYGSPVTFMSFDGLSTLSPIEWVGLSEDGRYAISHILLASNKEMVNEEDYTTGGVFEIDEKVIEASFSSLYPTIPDFDMAYSEDVSINGRDATLNVGSVKIIEDGKTLNTEFRSYVMIVKGNWYVFTGINIDGKPETTTLMEDMLVASMATIK